MQSKNSLLPKTRVNKATNEESAEESDNISRPGKHSVMGMNSSLLGEEVAIVSSGVKIIKVAKPLGLTVKDKPNVNKAKAESGTKKKAPAAAQKPKKTKAAPP